MKWNWGTKLIMVFSIFVLGMIALVVVSMRQKVEMVAQNYYKDELQYQEVLDATAMANGLSRAVKVVKEAAGISIQLPLETAGNGVKGDVYFYCSADAAKDRHLPLVVDEKGLQTVDTQKLMPGRYIVKISWESRQQKYYTEQTIIL